MDKILIVTPDLKIVFGKGPLVFFYKIYQKCLILQLKFLLSKYPEAIVLTSKALDPKKGNLFFYEDLQINLNYENLRKKVWKFTRNYFKEEFYWNKASLNNITETRTAIHFSLSVFPFFSILEDLIKKEKPSQIITITADSIPEKIGLKISRDLKIASRTFLIPNVSLFDKLIDHLLRIRQAKLRFDELLQLNELEKRPSFLPEGVLVEVGHPLQLKSAIPLFAKLKNCFLATDIRNLRVEIEKLISLKTQRKLKIRQIQATDFLNSNEIKTIYKTVQDKSKLWWEKVEKRNRHDFIFSLTKSYLKNTTIYYFPIAAVFVEVTERIFKKLRPKTAIVFSDRGFWDRSVALISKRFTILSILVSPNTNMSVDKTNNYDICDFVTVPGEHLKQELIKIGHKGDNIFVVGDLRFDNLPQTLANFDKAKICKKIGVDENKKIVLLISFHLSGLISAEEKRLLFQSTSQIIEKMPSIQLIIRPHPNEPIAALKAEFEEWNIKKGKIIENASLHELLYICDLVVMSWSMTGFEAMVFEKPVITFNFFEKNYDSYIPYVSKGAAIETKNKKELEIAIKTLLFKQNEREKLIKRAKEFNQYYLGKVDGKVAERIASLVSRKTLKE